jgi:hypothetical protein
LRRLVHQKLDAGTRQRLVVNNDAIHDIQRFNNSKIQ